MALAGTLFGKDRPDRPETVYGVILHLTPNPTRLDLQFEVQRAPDLAGAPDTGNAVSLSSTVGPFPGSGGRFIDALPNDGVKRWYRIRHVGDSVDPGTWSGWLGAAPYRIQITRWRPLSTHAPFDGMSQTSSWQQPQASIQPTTMDNNTLHHAEGGPATGKMFVTFTWGSGFTLYLPDGSSIAVPASPLGSNPGAPTLSQVAGGALGARTYFVRYAYVKDGMLYGGSAEASLAVSANNLLKVASPAAVAGYDGWIPLVATTTLLEVMQTVAPGTLAAPVAFGTDWTEPAAGARTTGGTTWNDDHNNAGITPHAWDLAASTTYFFYPYYDVANGIVAFAGGALTARNTQQASRATLDGRIPLTNAGALQAGTPAGGGSTSGDAGGSGTCLAGDMSVDIEGRGRCRIDTVQPGERLAGLTGWRLVERILHLPWEDFVEVTVDTGARVRVTPTHPFTLSGGQSQAAAELRLRDLLHVPAGFAEIVELRAVHVPKATKVSIQTDGDHLFWAGEGPQLILCHNVQVVS